MEMQVLLTCNWSCQACDQFSNLHSVPWVKKAMMTLDQMRHFIGEMKDQNAYLGRIRLLGGEPTLHPKFAEIVELLYDELVRTNHVGGLEVITNGTHMERIKPVEPRFVRIRVSPEREKERTHVANLINTPSSLGYSGTMCNQPWHCGFSLNYYGYFPCSSGAGIARMRDWMVWQRLSLPVLGVRQTWDDLPKLCDHCYHGLKPEDKIKCGSGKNPETPRNIPNAEAQGFLDRMKQSGDGAQWEVYAA